MYKNKEMAREYSKWHYLKNKDKYRRMHKDYYRSNIEKRKKYNHDLYLKDKEKRKKQIHEYYLANKNKICERAKIQYQNNREERIKRNKINYNNHKSERMIQNEKRKKDRRKSDPVFAMFCSIRAYFKYVLRKKMIKKYKPIIKYGVDINAIINHLGPCPGNRKDYHIDHIVPLSSFDFTKESDIQKAWHPTNLQWLPASHNYSKGKLSYNEWQCKKVLELTKPLTLAA